jgi:hypothetical protein
MGGSCKERSPVSPRFLSPPGLEAGDAIDEIRDLWATAAGYAVSIERCAEQGATARFAYELRQVLDCLSERIERLEQDYTRERSP